MQTGAILIADGFEPLRRLIGEALQRAGYAVLDAATAIGAEKLYEHGGVSLLICDVSLPGGALALALGLKQRRPDLPVLFLSLYEALSNGYSSGPLRGSGNLTKPFTITQLNRAVAALLRAERAAVQAG